jgi:hypothetical protein
MVDVLADGVEVRKTIVEMECGEGRAVHEVKSSDLPRRGHHAQNRLL